ncbi:MAG TPA: hypothetical protein VJZ51_02050 [Bacilli bacterium]|nr:hypothetical protein [Bacilli bacterium]
MENLKVITNHSLQKEKDTAIVFNRGVVGETDSLILTSVKINVFAF